MLNKASTVHLRRKDKKDRKSDMLRVLLIAVNAKYIHTCPAIYSLKAFAEKTIAERSFEERNNVREGGAAAGDGDSAQKICLVSEAGQTQEVCTEAEADHTQEVCTAAEVDQTQEVCTAAEVDQTQEVCTAADNTRNVSILTAEFTINDRYQDVLAGIMEAEADILAFSVYIWNVDRVRRLIRDIRKIRLDSVEIWAGGPEATYYPESFLSPERAGVDICLLGEGEEVFSDLILQAVEKRRGNSSDFAADSADSIACEGLESMRGLAFRKNEGIINTGLARPVDMNRIPFLYSDLSLFSNRILYYESSRGCPFSCSYCLSGRERGIRYRNPDTVERELQFFLDHQVRQVKFVDRTFNANSDFAIRVWTYIRDHDNGITNFHFEIEADCMTREELELLQTLRPGLIQMEIGVQSANSTTLKSIHRKPDLTKISDVMSALGSRQNINLHLDLIAGLPFEDLESFRHSFNAVYAMRPHQFQLGFLKLLKGTELWDRQEEYGLVCSQDAPYEVLRTRWLSFSDLELLHRISDRVEEFVNSQGFRRSLPLAETLFPDAFSLFEQLAAYYRAQGYEEKKPSAAQRYTIFAEFVKQAGRNWEHSQPWNPDREGCLQAGQEPEIRMQTVSSRKEHAQDDPDMEAGRIVRQNNRIVWQNSDWQQQVPSLNLILETIRLDQMLHIHASRRMTAVETFDFGDGPTAIQFDYRYTSPVNGEARIVFEEPSQEEMTFLREKR